MAYLLDVDEGFAVVEELLGSIGLGRYVDVFCEQGYDTMAVVQAMSDEDMEHCKMVPGHRLKLKMALGRVPSVSPFARQCGQDPTRKEPLINNDGYVNTPEQSRKTRERFSKAAGKGTPMEDWVCKCGFRNTYRNHQCGGTGEYGCKTSRSEGAVPGLGMASGGAAVCAPGYGRQNSSSSKLKSVPCKFYEKGQCAKGDMCPFFHDPHIDPAKALERKGKGKGIPNPGCLFLPRVADGLKVSHLYAYFSQFGKLEDVFGPIQKSVCAIAFIRYEDPISAERVLAHGQDHYLKDDLMVRVQQGDDWPTKGKSKGASERMYEEEYGCNDRYGDCFENEAAPKKRPRKNLPQVISDDPYKAELVEKIKSFQRRGEQQKLAWWDFCFELPNFVRDPLLHDVRTLQMFIDSNGI